MEYGYKDAEAELDHFLCYVIDRNETDAFKGAKVTLKDQFLDEPKPVDVKDHVLLCNPVEKASSLDDEGKPKEGEPKNTPRHPLAHLVCYELVYDFRTARTVTNQIDKDGRRIKVVSAYALCAPSGKNKVTKEDPKPKTPEIPPEKDLDHFACYSPPPPETKEPPGKVVHLKDQFVDGNFNVKSPQLLCNPVDKTVKGEKGEREMKRHHPNAHLVCYSVSPVKKGPVKEQAVIHSQFENPALLKTARVEYLCVPSTKKA
ncbi:hypothetical protein GCM10009105_32720 [Dokdonella soli]|uniref:Uncharacterized protein n=1 Tax=Dokdonella soli TaxID=529810 RepID=A0ABP3U0F2_9GAMM